MPIMGRVTSWKNACTIVETVIQRYTKTVKPMYLQFIEPSKRYADIIIPQGGHNKVAIDIITNTIEKSLREKQSHK